MASGCLCLTASLGQARAPPFSACSWLLAFDARALCQTEFLEYSWRREKNGMVVAALQSASDTQSGKCIKVRAQSWALTG